MIVIDAQGDVYELRVTDEPPRGAAFTSVELTHEDVMHEYFLVWFVEKIGPRIVHRHQRQLKEFP